MHKHNPSKTKFIAPIMRPMNEAPRDGTPILAHSQYGAQLWFQIEFHHEQWLLFTQHNVHHQSEGRFDGWIPSPVEPSVNDPLELTEI